MELYFAYGRPKQIAKARAAYDRLAPSPTLHALMVGAATRWLSIYEETRRESKWRFYLHNWIRDQHYLEDGPVEYEPPVKAARRAGRGTPLAGKPTPAPDATPPVTVAAVRAPETAASCPIPQRVKIVGVVADTEGRERAMAIDFEVLNGEYRGDIFTHAITYQSDDDGPQRVGQAQLKAIIHAIGFSGRLTNEQDLVGGVLETEIDRGLRQYAPSAANDDTLQPQQGGALRGAL